MKMRNILLALFAATILAITGCHRPQAATWYERPLPPGELALRKITNPADIPDFTNGCYSVADMSKAVDNSLNYLSKPSSKAYFPYGNISHQQAVDSLKAFKQMISSGLRGRELNNAIRDKFDVYISVGCDDKGTMLFTGYYTPILSGSMTRTDQYKYPLYKQPEDLAKGPNGEILGQHQPDGSFKKFPPRAELENSNMLAGKELIWLNDPFEAYIAHVQGSARIRLPDGRLTTVGYAANNGYDYVGISGAMIRDGRITASQLSLSAMIDFFKKNPSLVSQYTQVNPRFVFFTQSNTGPRGSLNEPVTTLRSIATDKSIYPRACLAFLSTALPRSVGGTIYQDPYDGFVLDQDTGGAIRAAGRCDVYMGEGDDAGKVAGQTYREGKLYYLFLKDLLPQDAPAQVAQEANTPAVPSTKPQAKATAPATANGYK